MVKSFSTLLHQLFKNPLLYGSFLVFLGTMAGNLFQFLFNLFMTRNLSVVDYGILASLMSLVMLPALVSSAIFPTVVSFASTFYAKNQLPMVKKLFMTVSKLSFVLGIVTFMVFVLFSEEIGAFFQITETFYITLAGATVFLGFITIVNNALLQAKLDFSYVSFISFLSSLLKFVFGAFFVLIGMSVTGAMLGMILASIAGYLLTFIPLRKTLSQSSAEDGVKLLTLLRFGGPAALMFFSLTSFITIDIVLVKHFFTPEEAGLYAGLSLVGRVIFFVSAPISLVLLPVLTQEHTKKHKVTKDIIIAFFLVLVPSVVLTTIYTLFPQNVIAFFLKNKEYLLISDLLPLFAVYITCYSLVFLLANIFLSIKRTEVSAVLGIGALTQIILICLFHESFQQVIVINLGVVSILLFVLLVYYLAVKGSINKHEKISD